MLSADEAAAIRAVNERLSERQKRLMRMHKGLGHPHPSDDDEV